MTKPEPNEIHDIIDAGRKRTRDTGPVRPVFLLAGSSLLLLWLSFTPMEWAPVAWIALTPLCLLLRGPQLGRRHYVALMICGALWTIFTFQWMRLGHWSMYFALLALSFYFSLYTVAFVGIGRRLVASGFPLWLTAPLVWTALEYLRAWLMTGFPWYFVGHSQYRWIEFIQIADLTGVAGITFIVLMSSAAIAQWIPASVLHRAGLTSVTDIDASQRWTGILACSLLVAASVMYGSQRQQPTTATRGPVVALVQGNFPSSVGGNNGDEMRMTNTHDLLTARAAQEQPDLIVWPESMWPFPDWIVHPDVSDDNLVAMIAGDHPVAPEMAANIIDNWRNTKTRKALANRSQTYGIPILFGLVTHVADPDGLKRFNSAAFIRPDLGYVGRFDKMHRVVFGEYVPLRSVFPFLQKLTPYNSGGIEAGPAPKIFEAGGYRYAPLICFEDTIPRLVRHIVNIESTDAEKPDVLVNLTNDSWFHGSSELDQHLITAAFRCVETRRPMVRAVNGGVSAFIDSSGRIREPERFLMMTSDGGYDGEFQEVESMINPDTGRWYRQHSAVLTGQIPVDGRSTVWLQFGDWLAMLCFSLTIALWVRSFLKGRLVDQKSDSST